MNHPSPKHTNDLEKNQERNLEAHVVPTTMGYKNDVQRHDTHQPLVIAVDGALMNLLTIHDQKECGMNHELGTEKHNKNRVARGPH